jgi:hypothetical protein
LMLPAHTAQSHPKFRRNRMSWRREILRIAISSEVIKARSRVVQFTLVSNKIRVVGHIQFQQSHRTRTNFSSTNLDDIAATPTSVLQVEPHRVHQLPKPTLNAEEVLRVISLVFDNHLRDQISIASILPLETRLLQRESPSSRPLYHSRTPSREHLQLLPNQECPTEQLAPLTDLQCRLKALRRMRTS